MRVLGLFNRRLGHVVFAEGVVISLFALTQPGQRYLAGDVLF